MNDLHNHFTAKALRTNFTDTERLLWPLTPPLKGGEIMKEYPIKGREIIDGSHREICRTLKRGDE
jgi:hypothetical protein